MATRKSAAGAKKPGAVKAKNTKRGGATAARRAHNPEVGGSTPSPATKRKKAAAKKAPRAAKAPVAQPAEQRRKAKVAGSKPAGGAPSESTTTEKLLKAAPAIGPDSPLTNEQELFVTEFMRNGQNGTAAYLAVHPNVTPGTAGVMAHRWLKNVKVAERIATERARLATKHEMTRDDLLAELVAIVRADPNELSQMRSVCCGKCWPEPDKGAKPDPAIELDVDLPVWQEPNPDCTHCQGEGFPRPWFADTRKLSPAARALFAGVHQTKDGVRLLTHSKLDAAEKIAKILGAYEKDNEQKADPIRDLLAALGRSSLPVVKQVPADG